MFQHFLSKLCSDRERQYAVESEVYQCLKSYNWPGNVRELQNVVERAVNLAEHGVISLQHLPLSIQKSTGAQIDNTVSRKENLQDCRQEKSKKGTRNRKGSIVGLFRPLFGECEQSCFEDGLFKEKPFTTR